MSEKCFCHLIDSKTGDKYVVKDKEAREKVSVLEGDVAILKVAHDNNVKEQMSMLERLNALEQGGGGAKMYRHIIGFTECPDQYTGYVWRVTGEYITSSPDSMIGKYFPSDIVYSAYMIENSWGPDGEEYIDNVRIGTGVYLRENSALYGYNYKFYLIFHSNYGIENTSLGYDQKIEFDTVTEV